MIPRQWQWFFLVFGRTLVIHNCAYVDKYTLYSSVAKLLRHTTSVDIASMWCSVTVIVGEETESNCKSIELSTRCFVAAFVAACTDSVVEAIACGTRHAVSQRLGVVVYMKLSVFFPFHPAGLCQCFWNATVFFLIQCNVDTAQYLELFLCCQASVWVK